MAKSNSEFKSIQKKLVAAVAMVLVASIMVVSSSYAWFTLSTAPEVTGIQTSVGSNGNLEMALRTQNNVNEIPSLVGQTMPNANATWGNLVDLSYNSEYGLDKITLAPARLNATLDEANTTNLDVPYTVTATDKADLEKYVVYSSDVTEQNIENAKYNGYPIKALGDITGDDATGWSRQIVVTVTQNAYMLNSTGFLQTPVYGTDGRVSQITANTVNGPYNKNNGTFAAGDGYGVRAVGVTSNISPAALALRNAKQAVNSAISTAKNGATTSLKVDSVKLANILINNKLTNQDTFSADDLTNVKNAIASLQNVATLLEDALKQAVVAVAVSQFPTKTFTTDGVTISTSDIIVKDSTDAVVTIDWDGVYTGEGESKQYTYPDLTAFKADLQAAYGVLDTEIVDKLDAAYSAANDENINTTAPTYTQLMAIMTSLLTVNDFEISKDGQTYTVGGLMDLGTGKAGLIMAGNPTINIKNGIYFYIAKFTDNYSSNTSLLVTAPEYGFVDEELKVNMQTVATAPANGFYLPAALAMMSALPNPDGVASELITDTYGYVLDFAFRTNAVGSNLLLQTSGVSRVGDDETAAVQGAGSFMKFKTNQTDYTQEQMLALMAAIRVVFVNDENAIYGVATLDVGYTDKTFADITSTTELEEGDTITIEGKSYVIESVGTFEELKEEGTTTGYKYATVTVQVPNYTVDADGYITAYLYLMNYSISADGILDLGVNPTKAASNAITALQQNQAQAVSALVYLDGDQVDNGDVAISGESMTGFMNLQFASSAKLDPMDYTFNTTPTLDAPTAAFDDNKVTITAAANTPDGVTYTLYTVIGDAERVLQTGVNAGSPYDLDDITISDASSIPDDTYTVYVKAVKAEGANPSEGVAAFNMIVAGGSVTFAAISGT